MQTHAHLDLLCAQLSRPDLVCGSEPGSIDASNVVQSHLRSGKKSEKKRFKFDFCIVEPMKD